MGSLADLGNMANVSLYGFEDYHGVDIGVVRTVRLWYTPFAGEIALEIKLLQGDTRLGFSISRTEEVSTTFGNHFLMNYTSININICNIIAIFFCQSTLSYRPDGTNLLTIEFKEQNYKLL
jgi:hypothetical protein